MTTDIKQISMPYSGFISGNRLGSLRQFQLEFDNFGFSRHDVFEPFQHDSWEVSVRPMDGQYKRNERF